MYEHARDSRASRTTPRGAHGSHPRPPGTSPTSVARKVACRPVATTFVYDPTASQFQDEMHEVYRVLRDEHPVYHDAVNDSYSLSRFEDVWQAVHDPGTFSSAGVAE